MRRLIYIAIFLLAAMLQDVSGQVDHLLNIHITGPDSAEVSKSLRYKTKLKNQQSAQKELSEILAKLYKDGYLAASFDSISSDSLQTNAWLFTGQQHRIAFLGPGNVDPVILNYAGYKKHYYKDEAFSYDEIHELNLKIIKYCENNGYPFAETRLDSIRIENGQLYASLFLDKKYLITIDSIVVKGSSKVKSKYLYNYLDIKPGQLYNESRIRKIDQKVKEIQFASEIKPFELGFTDEKASVYMYLDKKKASQFDGIIGIAPNNITTGKLLITGDVKLKLVSVLNRGEVFDLNWRKIQAGSQDLRIRFTFPFIFSSPFGIDYKFWLLKQDTSYINLNNHIGIQYHFLSNNYLKAYVDFFNSSLLNSPDTINISDLPENIDMKSTNYGLEYNLTKLDYLFNPRKGIRLLASGSYGRKTIKQNSSYDQEIYDSVELKNAIYLAGLEFDWFIPVFRRGTILLGLRSAYIENKNLFDNELYRIGGLKSLRGFDEESIYASFYSMLNAEFRFLLDRNSFFSLFWNGAFYEKNTVNEYFQDTPWGFGAGFSFETGAGIFSVYYAMGKQFDNPLSMKSAKIHFGYTSTF